MSKTDGSKLPKWLGGLKVPKAMRRAGFLEDLVSSPTGRELLAEALLKAAEAAAEVLRRHEAPEGDLAEATEAVSPSFDAMPEAALPEAADPAPETRPARRGRPRRAAVDPETEPQPTPPIGN